MNEVCFGLKPAGAAAVLVGLALATACGGARPASEGAGATERAGSAGLGNKEACPAAVEGGEGETGLAGEQRKGGIEATAARLVTLLSAGDADGVFSLFDPRMKEALPIDKTRAFVQGIAAARGKLTRPQRKLDAPNASSATSATFVVGAERGAWQLDVHLDAEGRIAGLRMTDPPPPEPPVRTSDVKLRLPFDGAWDVFWGGDTVELNQHVNHRSQRRAADLLVLGEDGKSHRGDGKQNGDYHSYGRPVRAVAAGSVTTVIDGIPDNDPGTMNAYMALGNAVIIEHRGPTPPRAGSRAEPGPPAPLFAVYAHLQPGRLRVKVGQKVRAGEVIGLVGNSGNSSEPHLHFQLQDGPRFEHSYGVEAVFSGVTVTRAGETSPSDAYTFRKGDRVAPAALPK